MKSAEVHYATLVLVLIVVTWTNIQMEQERFIALEKLLQHVTYNLHESLSNILTSASANSGHLAGVREKLILILRGRGFTL